MKSLKRVPTLLIFLAIPATSGIVAYFAAKIENEKFDRQLEETYKKLSDIKEDKKNQCRAITEPMSCIVVQDLAIYRTINDIFIFDAKSGQRIATLTYQDGNYLYNGSQEKVARIIKAVEKLN